MRALIEAGAEECRWDLEMRRRHLAGELTASSAGSIVSEHGEPEGEPEEAGLGEQGGGEDLLIDLSADPVGQGAQVQQQKASSAGHQEAPPKEPQQTLAHERRLGFTGALGGQLNTLRRQDILSSAQNLRHLSNTAPSN